MKLSVVIPCFNGEATLGDTLTALAAQEWDHPWEVIFADNGSTDNSRQVAQTFAERIPNLQIIDASLRQGQPYALNAGVAAAQGEAVAFCDADDVVGQGWLPAMGNALRQHPFVASRMDIELLNPRWVHSYRANPQQHGVQKVNYPPYFCHAGGGTLGVKRSLCLEVGGFDESLPYLHDTDFCFRVQMQGVALEFVPEATMHIRFRTSLKSIYRQACNYAEYNVLLAKRYEEYGLAPPDRWNKFAKDWFRLFRMTRKLPGGNAQKAAFLARFGWQVGQLRGIIKHRSYPVV